MPIIIVIVKHRIIPRAETTAGSNFGPLFDLFQADPWYTKKKFVVREPNNNFR
jgi:hypothetical protein